MSQGMPWYDNLPFKPDPVAVFIETHIGDIMCGPMTREEAARVCGVSVFTIYARITEHHKKIERDAELGQKLIEAMKEAAAEITVLGG